MTNLEVITDQNDKHIVNISTDDMNFCMLCGANTDLYWELENYVDGNEMVIAKSDSFVFDIFDVLFEKIKEKENPYDLTIHENVFTWISEYGPPEEANRLEIEHQKDKFLIRFIKHPSNGYKTCTICFCNSGSSHPKIEMLFMLLFNFLAYQKEFITPESPQKWKSCIKQIYNNF